MLGHRLSGVTGGCILKRVYSLLIDAANGVGDHIAALMRGEAPSAQVIQFRPRGRGATSKAEASAAMEVTTDCADASSPLNAAGFDAIMRHNKKR